eukprot:345185-Chlamydomonas_euryale.AAC.2
MEALRRACDGASLPPDGLPAVGPDGAPAAAPAAPSPLQPRPMGLQSSASGAAAAALLAIARSGGPELRARIASELSSQLWTRGAVVHLPALALLMEGDDGGEAAGGEQAGGGGRGSGGGSGSGSGGRGGSAQPPAPGV